MKAFPKELPPGSIALRVGTDTDRWGKPYDYEVTLLPDGTLTGLTRNPEREDIPAFNVSHMIALKRVVEPPPPIGLGRVWKFERINHDNQRDFHMPRKVRAQRHQGSKMPHANEAFDASGKLDAQKVLAGLTEAIEAYKSGEYVLVDFCEDQIGDTGIESVTFYRRRAKK